MDEIILIGTGGHARSCIDVLELEGKFELAGLVEKEQTDNFDNHRSPIIGNDGDLKVLRQKYSNALIAVGQIKSPKIRVRLYELLKQMNYNLPVIISPNAYVSKNAYICEGTIVMHDAIVNANAKVGKNCISNNKVLCYILFMGIRAFSEEAEKSFIIMKNTNVCP